METQLIEVSTGAKLYVAKAGTGPELILFLHAVGGDHSSWMPQIEAFQDRYTCISFDQRGHSRSEIPEMLLEHINVMTFAEDAAAVIAHFGFRRAHLVGLSMGGVVALKVFRRFPHLVQSLTLANTWAFHPEAEARIAFMQHQLEEMSLSKSSEMLIPGLFAPRTAQKIIDQAIRVEAAKDPDVFLASWQSMFGVDFREMLPSINVPVLLLGGTEDKVTPTDPLLTEIFANVPTSQLVNIDGAGHFSNLDHPAEFNRALGVFLGRSRSRSGAKTQFQANPNVTLEADTVAQGLMAMLSQRGVDCFFSNSGTDFTPIIDALARYQNNAEFKLKTIAIPHENTAIAMAHGHYLVSGRPQVVMAHVNVGTANMGLGIINAARSRIPMLVLAGKTPWYESDVDGCRTNFVQWGQDTFDQGAYFREFTKWDYELKGAFNLETIVDRALAIAASEPAGPVYLTLPKEALCQKFETPFHIHQTPRQQPAGTQEPTAEALSVAVNLIQNAKSPLIVTADAGRFRGAVEALLQFSETCAIPVIEHGKRNFFNFPTEHPLHLGFSPSPYVEQADLIIALECPVPWIPALSQVKTPPTLIQIGVDPLFQAIPMRSFPADVALAGDPAATLQKLTSLLSQCEHLEHRAQRRETIAVEHNRMVSTCRTAAAGDSSKSVITKRFLSWCIGQVVDDETVIFNEYNLDPQLVSRRLTDSWFENSVASGLGWSLGAALGAQLARPELTMVVTLGDGSYLFNTPLSAHYVAAAYNLPIIIVVFNDSAWTTIKKSYLGTTPEPWGVKNNTFPLCNFDVQIQFEKLAESCGGVGLTVSEPGDVIDTLKQAFHISRQERRHVLVNVLCERD